MPTIDEHMQLHASVRDGMWEVGNCYHVAKAAHVAKPKWSTTVCILFATLVLLAMLLRVLDAIIQHLLSS